MLRSPIDLYRPRSHNFPVLYHVRLHGGVEEVLLYDVRHGFASGGLLVGEGVPMVGKLLGYTQVQSTARNAHLANDPVKSAANRIASRIAEMAG